MKINKELLFPLLSALFITLFLFFIDEGYYNFSWMLKLANWAAFVIYFIPLFGIPFLLVQFLKKLIPIHLNFIISISIGSLLALFIVTNVLLQ